VVAYVGLMLFAVAGRSVKWTKREQPSPLVWLAVFSLTAICSTMIAAAFVTDVPVMSRYLIPVFFWPVVIVPVIVNHRLGRRFVAVGTVLSLLAAVSLIASSQRLASSNGLSARYYPSDIACVDDAVEREGLDNGIAPYWDAKYLQQFSRLNLNIAQYSDDLAETKWITSQRYFRPRYDFAVLPKDAESTFNISPDDLMKINGAPREIVACGSRLLYIYGKDGLHTSRRPQGSSLKPAKRFSARFGLLKTRRAKDNVTVG
jgi:hypothetical protein